VEFEECGGVPAVVALWSSSVVSGGALQIVEMKGSEMGRRRRAERAGAWSSLRETAAATAPLMESVEMVAASDAGGGQDVRGVSGRGGGARGPVGAEKGARRRKEGEGEGGDAPLLSGRGGTG
jgi:hypothetical protein